VLACPEYVLMHRCFVEGLLHPHHLGPCFHCFLGMNIDSAAIDLYCMILGQRCTWAIDAFHKGFRLTARACDRGDADDAVTAAGFGDCFYA